MARTEKPEYERILGAPSHSPFVFQPYKTFSAYDESVRLRFHEEMEIKYVRSGTLSVNLGSQIVVAEAGDLVIINPYEYHANLVEEGTAHYDMLCVDVSDNYMGGLVSEFFRPYREGKYRFKNLIKDKSVIQNALSLFDALAEEKGLLSEFGCFLMLFDSLSAYREQPSVIGLHGFSRRQREFVYTVFSFIHEHYGENIRLAELAGKCYMTEAHFSRTFKELMGEPPVSYINRYRINMATALLSTTALSLKEIAARVGFSDAAYFSRAFRKYKGESPTAYMRSGRE